jgi:ribosomal protein S18 acetylase RimI-like enzyme
MAVLMVREMRPADLAAVIRLWRSSPGVGLDADSDNPAALESYLKRNPGTSFVAISGARIIGAVLCGHEGRRGYLGHLAVSAPFRRHGIGAALVDRCLTELNRRGIPKCNIVVFGKNRSGLRFWKAAGWKARPDLVFMQKPTCSKAGKSGACSC